MRVYIILAGTLFVILMLTVEGTETGDSEANVLEEKPEAATPRKGDNDNGCCIGTRGFCRHDGQCCAELVCYRAHPKKRPRCTSPSVATSNCRSQGGFCNDGMPNSECCAGSGTCSSLGGSPTCNP